MKKAAPEALRRLLEETKEKRADLLKGGPPDADDKPKGKGDRDSKEDERKSKKDRRRVKRDKREQD